MGTHCGKASIHERTFHARPLRNKRGTVRHSRQGHRAVKYRKRRRGWNYRKPLRRR